MSLTVSFLLEHGVYDVRGTVVQQCEIYTTEYRLYVTALCNKICAMIPTDRAVESIMKLFKLSQALHNTTYTYHSINTSQNIIQFSEQN